MSTTTSRRSGVTLLTAAGLTLVGCVYVAVVAATSDVPSHLYRAPLSRDAAALFAVYAALLHLITLTGVIGLRRSGITGADRSLTAVAAGTALLFACELATISLRDSAESASGATVVNSCFGLATIVVAVGMIAAGRTALRSSTLGGWARRAPLMCGVLSLLVIPIQFTPVIWLGVAVYAVGYGVLGLALVTDERELAARPATA